MRYLPEGLPGTAFKATGRKYANALQQCVDLPFEFVKKQMREGRHKTSYLSQAIEDIGSDAEMEFIHKWSALSLFTGGADTVTNPPLSPAAGGPANNHHNRLSLH